LRLAPADRACGAGRLAELLALDIDEQSRSGFRYNFAVYQVEYSRNLNKASARLAAVEDV
jgi:hypothetical protein